MESSSDDENSPSKGRGKGKGKPAREPIWDDQGYRVCFSMADNGTCWLGKNCTFSHDVPKWYTKQKEKKAKKKDKKDKKKKSKKKQSKSSSSTTLPVDRILTRVPVRVLIPTRTPMRTSSSPAWR